MIFVSPVNLSYDFLACIHCVSSLSRFLFVLLYSAICSCVLVVLVKLSVLAK